MVPPSLHPDGEYVRFDLDGEPACATWAQLLASQRLTATAVEISPKYERTSRHAITLALAGVLAKQGYDRAAAQACVTALCAITSDEELADRLRAVDDTYERHGQGKPIQGWEALHRLLGRKSAGHLQKWFNASPRDGRSDGAVAAEHDLNDAGNADRIVKLADGNLAYVEELQAFMIYDRHRWHRDEHGLQVRLLAERAVHAELEQLKSAPVTRHEARVKFLERSLNNSNIRNALEMTKSRVPVPLEALDAHPDLLGYQGGVLNLQTGKPQDNSREDYITRCANVVYDPAATCPLFDAFLNETFGGNVGLIRYVTGLLGYCLTGRTQFQQFWIWTGEGANGKSTLISIMQRLMGDYTRAILGSTLFEGHLGEQGNYDLAQLTGVRLAVAPEAESKYRLHAARLKQLTGGDTMAVRAIYRAPFSFRPCAKIIIVCNRRPELDAYDEALKRRIRVVPFDHQVPLDRQDPDLVQKLTGELPGILNRLVAAGAEFIASQSAPPDAVLKATQGYFADKDYISWFLGDCMEKRPGGTMSKAHLYGLYLAWCEAECLPHVSKSELTGIMKKKGYEETRSSAMRGWKDLRERRDEGGETEPEHSDEELWADFTGAAANTA